MNKAILALALFGVFAGRIAIAQPLLCAGAQGSSTACAPACSNQVVNDDVVAGSNNGKFDVGNGNQGDGNDGFNNVGNFNIGSGNQGNCVINSGQLGMGSCDPSNNAGQIVLRFCQVYPTDQKCQPSGYLAEYTQALIAAIPGVIAQCNGGAPAPPVTSTGPSPPTPPTPGLASPPTPPPTPVLPTPAPAPTSQPTVLPPGMAQFTQVSSSTASLVELLELFEEHIAQEKALGRKLKL